MNPIKKNALANYGNFVAIAILGLIVNPLLVAYLGGTAFGVWKTCQRLLNFATVADGRATQALKWFIAHQALDTDGNRKQRQVGATIVVWVLWLPFLVLLQIAIIYFLPLMINDTPPAYETTLYWVGALLALNVLVAGIVTIPDSVLVGSNMGYRSMMVSTAVTIASSFAMVIFAYYGFGIPWLGLILLVAALVNGAITTTVAKRHITWFAAARPQRNDVGALAKFSGWVLVWSLVSKFLLSTEVILLGAVFGALTVTDFIFTSYMIQFALAICLMTASAFMPSIGKLLGAGDNTGASEIASETRDIVFAFATAICCFILLFNGPFVSLWVGEAYFLGPETNVAIALAFLQLAMIRCDAQIQDTGLRIGGKVTIGVASTLLSVGLGFLLLITTSSVAAMIAGLIIGRLPMSVGYPYMVRQMFGKNKYLSLRAVIIAIALVTLSTFLTWRVPDGFDFLVFAFVGSIAIPAICFFAMLTKMTRSKFFAVYPSRHLR